MSRVEVRQIGHVALASVAETLFREGPRSDQGCTHRHLQRPLEGRRRQAPAEGHLYHLGPVGQGRPQCQLVSGRGQQSRHRRERWKAGATPTRKARRCSPSSSPLDRWSTWRPRGRLKHGEIERRPQPGNRLQPQHPAPPAPPLAGLPQEGRLRPWAAIFWTLATSHRRSD